MLISLLKKLVSFEGSDTTSVSYESASLSDDNILIAIGDIHGKIAQLNELLLSIDKRIDKQKHSVRYIFLGDYIDRGPSSKEVIDRLLKFKENHTTTFLLGNHEETLLKFLEDPINNSHWLDFGGRETLMSYGVKPSLGTKTDHELSKLGFELKHKLPTAHFCFLENLLESYTKDDFMFVHAGVNPLVPLHQNKSKDLLWIRKPFLTNMKLYQKLIVHGHTITENGQPEIRPNRVGIDTGSYLNGKITAMIIDGKRKEYLTTNTV